MARNWPLYDIESNFYASLGEWRVKLTTELPCGHSPSTNAKSTTVDGAEQSALKKLKRLARGHKCNG